MITLQNHPPPNPSFISAHYIEQIIEKGDAVFSPFLIKQIGRNRHSIVAICTASHSHFQKHLGITFAIIFISTRINLSQKPNTRVEGLNLNDSQRLTRPGPRLFSPALRAFLARQNNRVLRRSAMLRPLTLFEAGCLCPPFGRLGVNRALGSRDINIWR